MKVLVTGGSGFLGKYLIEALARTGSNISCFVRSEIKARKPEIYRQFSQLNVNFIVGDITSAEDLQKALEDDYDCVFHLAGILDSRDRTSLERINVGGTAALVAAVRRCESDVGRVVYMSSISAMGNVESEKVVDERVAPSPTTPYELTKRKGEELVERLSEEHGIDVTVVRAPMIYGYGEHAGILRLSKIIARGVVPKFGFDASMPVVYAGNLAQGLMLSAEKSEKALDLYIISDASTPTFETVVEHIAGNLKIKPLRVRVPRMIVNLASRKFEYLRYVAGNLRFSIDKAVNELGYRPEESLSLGLKETAQYHVMKGLLDLRNLPVSPLETLKMGLSENEGLGTAYEYFVKSKILTRYLRESDEPRKTLVILFPRAHGSVADITASLEVLGIQFSVMIVSETEQLAALKTRYDLIILVGDFIRDMKKTISILLAYCKRVILFSTNGDNIFHISKWNGITAREISKSAPVRFDYTDCPPFPSGIKLFAGKNPTETIKLRTAAFLLSMWAKVDLELPVGVKQKLSHMTVALYAMGS